METTSDSAPLLTDGGSIYERIRNRRRGGWGYWGWQPEKLQWLLGPMPFMFFMGTYCTVYSLVTAGYRAVDNLECSLGGGGVRRRRVVKVLGP